MRRPGLFLFLCVCAQVAVVLTLAYVARQLHALLQGSSPSDPGPGTENSAGIIVGIIVTLVVFVLLEYTIIYLAWASARNEWEMLQQLAQIHAAGGFETESDDERRRGEARGFGGGVAPIIQPGVNGDWWGGWGGGGHSLTLAQRQVLQHIVGV